MFSFFYHLRSLEIPLLGANACLAETADVLLLSHISISNWLWIFFYFTVGCGVCEQPQVYLLSYDSLMIISILHSLWPLLLVFLFRDNDCIWFSDLIKISKPLAVLISWFLEAVMSVVARVMLLGVLGAASGFAGFILEPCRVSCLRSNELLKKNSA
jgi:hypothetical protein